MDEELVSICEQPDTSWTAGLAGWPEEGFGSPERTPMIKEW